MDSAEDKLLVVASGLDDVRRTGTGEDTGRAVDVERSVPPSEIEVKPAIGGQGHAQSRRSLPIPIGIAFGSPSSIIDLRDTRRIPPRERQRQINRSLAAGHVSAFSQRIERSIFEKPTCLQRTTSPFRRNIHHATHRVSSPEHTLGASNDFNFLDIVRSDVPKVKLTQRCAVHDRAVNQDQRLIGRPAPNPNVRRCPRSTVLNHGQAR